MSTIGIPNLFIAGEGTSGTHALFFLLKQHPDIFMPKVKELNYFSTDFHDESDAFHHGQFFFPVRTKEEYLAYFKEVRSEKIIGDASASYTSSRVAAQTIRRFNPDAKIIIHLREPTSYLYSFYSALARRTFEPAATFEEALSLEPERRRRHDLIPNNLALPSYVMYSDRIKYYDKVKRFYDHFPKERIKINIFEDFKKDNMKTFRDVLSFLEVDGSADVRVDHSQNTFGVYRSKALNHIVYNRYIRKGLQRILPPSVYFKAALGVAGLLEKKTDGVPLNPETKYILMQQFKPEVEKASDLIGIDLVAKWGYSEV